MKRTAKIERKSTETQIEVECDLDGSGICQITGGHPFINHLIAAFAKHGGFDIKIKANGDLKHHLIEDMGLTLGEAFRKALVDMSGIRRIAFSSVPMDDALVEVSVDLSCRPRLSIRRMEMLPIKTKESLKTHCESPLQEIKLGQFGQIGESQAALDSNLIEEFLYAFTNKAQLTLHIIILYGYNIHHILEALFKALGQALHFATRVWSWGIPSTKGLL